MKQKRRGKKEKKKRGRGGGLGHGARNRLSSTLLLHPAVVDARGKGKKKVLKVRPGIASCRQSFRNVWKNGGK